MRKYIILNAFLLTMHLSSDLLALAFGIKAPEPWLIAISAAESVCMLVYGACVLADDVAKNG